MPCRLCPRKRTQNQSISICCDGPLWVDGVARRVIQAPKPEPRIMRYELTDYEWASIKPMLPNKPHGVPRVNDRRVLNGIFWVLRSVRRGVICRRTMGLTRLAMIASFADVRRASGSGLWTHLSPLMTRQNSVLWFPLGKIMTFRWYRNWSGRSLK